MKKMDKKAFTLIELLVVIAVVGILVLLAAPRFTSYVQDAQLTRIQQDIKVMEQEVGAVLINNDDDFNSWENNSKDLNQLVEEKVLFEKEDIAEAPIGGQPYKIIPEKYKGKINTKLKGTFYANRDGKVYYERGKPLSGIPTEPEKELVYSDEEIEEIQSLIDNGFIPVATAEELNNIRSATLETYGKGTKWKQEYTGGLDKKYVQVANIDLSKYSGEGWNPIGDNSSKDSSSRFTGTYDGGNYVITGLVVKGDGEKFQGLFGYTEGADIRNVGLIGNKVTGVSYVGGLVGEANSSTIENSYATGSVKSSGSMVGGLVGYAYKSTIKNSYATGTVISSRWYVGGLAGYAGPDSMISNSYATGSVTGQTDVGGLVGFVNYSTISKSYATGSVKGTGSPDDFTGYNVGGLMGRAYRRPTIKKSYWDTETTGQANSAGEEIGKTTVEMKDKDTYSGWDFVNVWKIDEGKDYPKLR